MTDEAKQELQRRANAYAAEAVARIGTHRYHGCEGTQAMLVGELEADIAKAFVIGFAAGVTDESARAAASRKVRR